MEAEALAVWRRVGGLGYFGEILAGQAVCRVSLQKAYLDRVVQFTSH